MKFGKHRSRGSAASEWPAAPQAGSPQALPATRAVGSVASGLVAASREHLLQDPLLPASFIWEAAEGTGTGWAGHTPGLPPLIRGTVSGPRALGDPVPSWP